MAEKGRVRPDCRSWPTAPPHLLLTTALPRDRSSSRGWSTTAAGQLETFIGDAKISRKQSPADEDETLSEGTGNYSTFVLPGWIVAVGD